MKYSLVNKDMVAAAVAVLEDAASMGEDFPYTIEQMARAILASAMEHYTPKKMSLSERRSSRKKGHVYFVTDGENVKIGKANNLKARISSLQTSTAKELKLLGYTKGGVAEEKRLHQKFGHLHVKGEWFKDSGEIFDYISLKKK